MYGIMKGMRTADPQIQMIGSHNWYDEYAEYLVGRQYADGHWPQGGYASGSLMNSAFSVLILTPTIASPPPVAELAVDPLQARPGQEFTFDASHSYHLNPERTIVQYDFDFGDGTTYTETAASAPDGAFDGVTTHTYPDTVADLEPLPGQSKEYVATVTVTDDEPDGGRIDTASESITLSLDNHAPVAVPGGPYTGYAGVPLTVTGIGSYDPDQGAPLYNHVVSYEWELDAVAPYDFDDAVTMDATWTWGTVGTCNIGLRVTDRFGETHTAWGSVNIEEGIPTELLNRGRHIPYSDTGQLHAILTAATPTADPLGGMEIAFYVDENKDGQFDDATEYVDTVVTDNYGEAKCPYTVTLAPDLYQIKAVFAGQDPYFGTSAMANLNVEPEATVVSYTGDPDQVETGTWTLGGVADVAPGSYVVRVTISDEDGGSGFADTTINVQQEDARATYVGPLFVSTDPRHPDHASVELRAVIRDVTAVIGDADHDPQSGHIAYATVTFVNRGTGQVIASGVRVNLIDADIKTGVAVYDWDVSLNKSTTAESFTIGTIVDGFYTEDSSDANVVVTVARPDGDFITGGGYLVNQSSAGTYAGDQGLRTNFGFNVKYNRRLTHLRGHFNGIVRQEDGTVLQIKSNATRSLVVFPDLGLDGGATFVSKANLTDVTDPDQPEGNPIAGNLTLIVTMTDNGEPGSSDTIGFTLWDGNELLFSSHWDGSQTLEQLIDGGNLAVHARTQRTNWPPVLDEILDRTLDEGQTLTLTATATDADGGLLTYSLATAPAGAVIDACTDVFTWTPSEAGSYPVTVRVTDGGTPPMFDTETFTITVNDTTVTLSIDDVTAVEGDPLPGTTAFDFTVSLSGAVAEDVTVVVDTNPVTATGGGTDYADLVGQTVTFTAGGALTQTVTVDVTRELLAEADETFQVNLSDARFGGVADPTRVTIADAQGIGQITNDDGMFEDPDLEEAVRIVLRIPVDYSDLGHLSSLAPLSGLGSLRTLVLQRAGLDDSELATLGNPGELESLDLRYNQLTGVSAVAGLPSLSSLLLYGNPMIDLSSLGGKLIRIDLPPEDVDHADTITELADALYNLPIEMYEHVVNTFEFEPYAGAMKGPQAVLETGAGNDWEIASLLAAMLDNAAIATRYVTGQIEVPIDAMMDYLAVTDPAAAALLLVNAGIDQVLVSGPSGPVAMRLDHTWLEAELPAAGGGTEWVAMDPSWKFKDLQPGVPDLSTLVPFYEDGYLSQTRKELAYEYYEDQVREYLAANQPGISIADVPYDGPIITRAIDAIPSSLPYSVLSTAGTNTTIPASMTHRVRVTLRQGGTELFSTLLSVPEVSLSRLTVSYAPAGGGWLTPQLRIDGSVVASGPSVSSGSGVELDLFHFEPGDDAYDRSFTYGRTAGQYLSIGLDARQVSEESIIDMRRVVNDAAVAQANGGPVDVDDQTGGLLHLAVMKWFYDTDRGEDIIDGLTGAAGVYNSVASGITTAHTTVDYYPDLQVPYVPNGVGIDVANNYHLSFPIDNDTSGDAMRKLLIGHNGCAQEHAIWEDLVNVESISTIKSFQLARLLEMEIFTIASSNADVYLPQLTHRPAIRDAIEAEVNAGATVRVPEGETPLNQWGAWAISGVWAAAKRTSSLAGSTARRPWPCKGGRVPSLQVSLPGIHLPVKTTTRRQRKIRSTLPTATSPATKPTSGCRGSGWP